MAYIEIYKNGKIVNRQFIEEQKAQKGCKIRLGSAGEIRLTLGKTETIGEFKFRLLKGDIPNDVINTEQKTSDHLNQKESVLPLDFSSQQFTFL